MGLVIVQSDGPRDSLAFLSSRIPLGCDDVTPILPESVQKNMAKDKGIMY